MQTARVIRYGFPLILIALLLGLFRGWLDQGIQMDEVHRPANLIPLFNENAQPQNQSIFDVDLFGIEIPVMYKEYISSAFLIKFLPMGLFDDYSLGLRISYLFYFALSVIVFFLLAERHNRYVAVGASLLIVTAPQLYPHVRTGFAETLHILFLTLAAYCLHRFFSGRGHRGWLFLASFLLFFAVNQIFYTAWTVSGLAVASIVIFPEYWKRAAFSFKNLAAIAAGAVIGLFHFVYYNVATGFPTLNRLFLFLFDREAYNRAPIDYSQALPFSEDMVHKLRHIEQFYEPYSEAYGALILFVVAVFAAGAYFTARQGCWLEYRLYLFPFLAFSVTLVLILLSPKGTRAGHYAFLIPLEQITYLSAALLAGRLVKRRFVKKFFLFAIPAILLAINLHGANLRIVETNRTGGVRLYTPAVFDFVEYLDASEIDSRQIFFLAWGLQTPTYFLKEGEFVTNSLVFQLYGKRDPEELERVLRDFFASVRSRPAVGNRLYFPLYAAVWPEIAEALTRLSERHNGELTLEKSFLERDGTTPAILLYRLDAVEVLSAALRDQLSAKAPTETWKITNWGPRTIEPGRPEDLAIWFIADDITSTTRVVVDGLLLKSFPSGDHITASVPHEVIREPGEHTFFLYDSSPRLKSVGVQLRVTE